MASISLSRTVSAAPDVVWNLIGGFGSLPDWLPFITASTLERGGRVRRLTTADGGVVTEELTSFDAARRSYSYTIVDSPFPVSAYDSTIRVHSIPSRPDEAEVQWSGRFFPGTGTEAELETLFAGIYRDGLEALSGTIDGR
ncbi:SRPBCC family protein [Tsukamurella sp. M9C]|uniref:SRPBCC family protein n=1 Tax=Tsukamurella sp. M9C TaxID=2877520 RepID=UPI001CC97303|nr:SRPBCC family protein [Tsukamurella sp. M9C]MCA0156226.1 SRPBCC family protein [Tsukamurella sp. M9C]